MKHLVFFLAALLPFFTSCNDTDEPQSDPAPPFTLKADRLQVEVGEPVTFTVISSDGQDVTAASLICSGTNCYVGNVVTWNNEGTYIVEAHFQNGDPAYPGGVPSQNQLTVRVGNGAAAYTISADATMVQIGEPVTFTVAASDGSDVTADCLFRSGTTTYDGHVVSWEKAGSYDVDALYQTDDPAYPDGIPSRNSVTVTVVKPSTTYTVSADRENVRVGEPVVFSVLSSEGEDVSTRFTLREPDGKSYLGRTRSYPAAGTYVVEAYLENKPEVVSANRVTIHVDESTAATDPNRFYRRTLLAEMTATWCWSCHFMIDAIHYCTEDLLYDRAVVVAFHDEQSEQGNLPELFVSIMTSYYTQLVANIPAYVMDWNANFASNSMFANLEASTPDMVADIRASQQTDTATAGIAVATTLSGRELAVTIRVTAREAQEYWLGAVLVEDNIEGYQHSASDPFYHTNVGQAMVTRENELAERIGRLDAGQEETHRYTVTIPAACVPANCRVVAYVCKTSADTSAAPLGYLVSNAVSCPVGKTVDYQYEPVAE